MLGKQQQQQNKKLKIKLSICHLVILNSLKSLYFINSYNSFDKIKLS